MEKIDHQIGIGCLEITDKEKEYVMDTLDKKRLSHGPYLTKLENTIASLHGCKYGISMNSGTSALRTAVACLKETEGWKDGDEILVPAVTFIATSNVIISNGLKPVFVDVEPDYYNIDPAKIEEKITERTKGMIIVHQFGLACDMDPIMELVRKHKLKLIEDTCETMFVGYGGKPVGSFADISCFSTYVAHLITTGVGGIATTNNPEYAVILKSLANHGRDSIYINIDDDRTSDEKKLFDIVERRFKFVRLGYSYRITEMEGAIGVAQLERKDEILRKRQNNAAYLTEHLKQYGDFIQLPATRPKCEHAFMMYPIVVKAGSFTKRDIVNFLEKNNIETRDMNPLINQPVYIRLFGNIEDQYPVSKWINENGFYIGCHQEITQKELEYIIIKFGEFFAQLKNTGV
ncbi:MAG: DegT/DnrJ/EryC1/StrS family aminotransferase [Candidatus Aenigmarchaeota archaeon]|nr:DegT/DnrJ/EryC1/StrS family aminotransferase [Candidatus Aenigmarchaeota archaeon]